jgi:hypothetical protein
MSRRKRIGHRGPEARKEGSHRETSVAQKEKDNLYAKFAEDRAQI